MALDQKKNFLQALKFAEISLVNQYIKVCMEAPWRVKIYKISPVSLEELEITNGSLMG